MSYQRQTYLFNSIAPDRIPQDVNAETWDDSHNIIFKNMESYRISGDSPTLPGATVIPETCVFIQGAGKGYWVYANTDGIWAHDGIDEFDITPVGWALAPTESTVWTSCVLGGVPYINASDRAPVYWDLIEGNACQPLPDWPAGGVCIALRAHKNFLMAIGMISEGSQRVRWSDAAEANSVPQFWTPAADNLAGFLDLAPVSSPCVEGMTLRDSFVIYKQESMWALDFVGGNLVFAARKMFSEHGAAATNAVTGGIDDVHLFVGDDGDVFLHDGVRVQSVLDGRAQRSFYGDFSANKNRKFSALTVSKEKLGLLIYPGSGQDIGTKALIYSFADSAIGFRDMPNVYCAAQGPELLGGGTNVWDGDNVQWDDDLTTWPQEIEAITIDDAIIGTPDGFFMVSRNTGEDAEGKEVSARLYKSGLDFGDAQGRKMLGRVWPKVEGRDGDTLEIRIGGQDITSGGINLAPAQSFVIGGQQSIDAFIQGRFISIEITSNGGSPWRLGSIDFEVRRVGKW